MYLVFAEVSQSSMTMTLTFNLLYNLNKIPITAHNFYTKCTHIFAKSKKTCDGNDKRLYKQKPTQFHCVCVCAVHVLSFNFSMALCVNSTINVRTF